MHMTACGKGSSDYFQRQLGIYWSLHEIEMRPILISSTPSSCKPVEFNKLAVIKCQMAALQELENNLHKYLWIDSIEYGHTSMSQHFFRNSSLLKNIRMELSIS